MRFTFNEKRADAIQLQACGLVKAKPAAEFKIGELMAWNFGYVSEVVGILFETKAFITFETLCHDGKVYPRRLKKDRLVAMAKTKKTGDLYYAR